MTVPSFRTVKPGLPISRSPRLGHIYILAIGSRPAGSERAPHRAL